ncbi:sulfurtransferase [Roseovarius sp. SCSIO 43702]|uniref:rhodanese-like domain-containing protein n=1 Tax=Roseovarius sp. SCSIO 43702 TaxID=2823043 RepID=UPI001C72C247|nr:rhodanese-like domain-containing protein [Roseovarius sp. SCSIO 43702]QYX58369.1 sulfurtransferase [Roseovarius sp. SCSIO 43702]
MRVPFHPAPLAALALGLSLLAAPAPLLAADDAPAITSSVAADTVPQKKRTTPGLYVTAAEAAALLDARDDILLIDVRTPEETMFVGVPTAADANIPLKTVDPAHRLDEEKGSYAMTANPAFVPATRALIEEEDPAAVLVMCRSGTRSAAAVNALASAGIEVPLYSVIDGFEGDKDKDTGHRSVNGWKNAGADWTYEVPAGLLRGAD